ASAPGIQEKSYAWDAGWRAITEHLARIGTPALVERALSQFYQVDYRRAEPPPRVSIVIPSAFARNLVHRCIASVLTRSTYPNFEVVLVVNRGCLAARHCAAYLRSIGSDPRVRVLDYPDQAFNYSKINNWAIRQCVGDIVCLMNDDMEVI